MYVYIVLFKYQSKMLKFYPVCSLVSVLENIQLGLDRDGEDIRSSGEDDGDSLSNNKTTVVYCFCTNYIIIITMTFMVMHVGSCTYFGASFYVHNILYCNQGSVAQLSVCQGQ